MSAKDFYHQTVKQSLVKAGWTITHDPFPLKWFKRNLSIDLGAEQLIAAEQRERKIAVEVKSFIGDSIILDLEKALGQYILYHKILQKNQPERELYLAIPLVAFEKLFEQDKFDELLLEDEDIKILIFNPKIEEIVKWIP